MKDFEEEREGFEELRRKLRSAFSEVYVKYPTLSEHCIHEAFWAERNVAWLEANGAKSGFFRR